MTSPDRRPAAVLYYFFFTMEDLFQLIYERDHKQLKKLLRDGRDVNSTGHNGENLIMFAALVCETAYFLKLLISFGANLDHLDLQGRNILHYAAGNDHWSEPLNYLLQIKASRKWINKADFLGNVPLHGYFGTVVDCKFASLILEKGAALLVKNDESRYPKFTCCCDRRPLCFISCPLEKTLNVISLKLKKFHYKIPEEIIEEFILL